MAHNSESRENQDVYLRMPKEPEKMLVKDRVSPSRGVKERSIEVPVEKEYRDSRS